MSTEALIRELHRREYNWDALEHAGLHFSSLQRTELLYYLKRDATTFREILANTSLGLSVLTTRQLLRALSKRSDLTAALRESGLGAGTDFHCSFDESPRDGGCQMKCDKRDCSRAEAKCKQLGHCISIDANRDRSWATLKSLQVFIPTPPPVCEGYAFGANGSQPIPIAAPRTVVFDDLPTASDGLGIPNEDWCYRDTSVRRPAAAACTFESCFDLGRCRPAASDPPSSPLRLYIDTPVPQTADMVRWPSCMRQTLQSAIVEQSDAACLVIPTVNINCEWDVCDPATHSRLRAMPSWAGNGRNHLIWDYIDHEHVKYR